MTRFALKFLSDRKGATAIEYALLATLLGVVIAAAVTNLGTALWAKFNLVANATNN